MPLYEYVCDSGHRTEEWWHLSDESLGSIACRKCGEEAIKVPSIPAFHTEEIDSETGLKIFKGDPLVGTPFEGDDGVNPLHYDAAIRSGKKEGKIQVDLSRRDP